MKIRTSLVSNSSSTSYIVVTDKDIKRLLHHYGLSVENELSLNCICHSGQLMILQVVGGMIGEDKLPPEIEEEIIDYFAYDDDGH